MSCWSYINLISHRVAGYAKEFGILNLNLHEATTFFYHKYYLLFLQVLFVYWFFTGKILECEASFSLCLWVLNSILSILKPFYKNPENLHHEAITLCSSQIPVIDSVIFLVFICLIFSKGYLVFFSQFFW